MKASRDVRARNVPDTRTNSTLRSFRRFHWLYQLGKGFSIPTRIFVVRSAEFKRLLIVSLGPFQAFEKFNQGLSYNPFCRYAGYFPRL